MREAHIVPLATQAVEILRGLHRLTGHGLYLFPSIRSVKRVMSENTVNAALRRLGYGTDEMTGHGFRRTASTLLNERGFNRDWIERQLAHSEADSNLRLKAVCRPGLQSYRVSKFQARRFPSVSRSLGGGGNPCRAVVGSFKLPDFPQILSKSGEASQPVECRSEFDAESAATRVWREHSQALGKESGRC